MDVCDPAIAMADRLAALAASPDLVDAVACLKFTYTISSSLDAGETLLALAAHPAFPLDVRTDAALAVAEHTGRWAVLSRRGYDAAARLARELLTSCTQFVVRRSYVYRLAQSPSHMFASASHLRALCADPSADINVRYKTAIGVLDLGLPERRETYFAVRSAELFLDTDRMHAVMAAQLILARLCGSSRHGRIFARAVEYLVDTAHTGDYTDRADAADVLVHADDAALRDIGAHVLALLGSGDYTRNAQNVHIRSIEQSCIENIEKLYAVPGVADTDADTAFSELCETLAQTGHAASADTLRAAFDRIAQDKMQYTARRVTLAAIFARVWAFVSHSPHKDTLAARIAEELTDAGGQCATGFMARLVNALSGFHGFAVGTDFSDQIAARFSVRLNAAIATHPRCDDILAELAAGPGPLVRDVLRTHLSHIRETLAAEFAADIPDTDFDLYFKKAYVQYYL